MAPVSDVAAEVLHAAVKAAKDDHSEKYLFKHFASLARVRDERFDIDAAIERARKSWRWPWK